MYCYCCRCKSSLCTENDICGSLMVQVDLQEEEMLGVPNYILIPKRIKGRGDYLRSCSNLAVDGSLQIPAPADLLPGEGSPVHSDIQNSLRRFRGGKSSTVLYRLS